VSDFLSPPGTQLHIIVNDFLSTPPGTQLHIVNDLHGQLWDLEHIFEEKGLPSKTNLFLFNGDMVDRGPFGFDVILRILEEKVKCATCVFVNRGNHEDMEMSRIYGFTMELFKKFAVWKDANDVWNLLKEIYEVLPLMTVVNGEIVVVHGGIPIRSSDARCDDPDAMLQLESRAPDEYATHCK
jgi:hypothetical protein